KLAVELIKMGAYDYITKPLYPDEILNTINKAIEAQKVINQTENNPSSESRQSSETADIEKEEFVIGKSAVSQELIRQIKLVAPTNYSVILNGESGTGKESV